MLQNRIYLGETTHKGNFYPGEHEPIVERELWERVHERLAENRVSRMFGDGAKRPSLLAGLLFDAHGERMTPSHAVKKGKRYCYYVSNSLATKSREAFPDGLRIPAGEIEKIILQRLKDFFSNRSEVYEAVRLYADAAMQKRILRLSAALAKDWTGLPPAELRRLLMALIPRIELHPAHVDIHVAR